MVGCQYICDDGAGECAVIVDVLECQYIYVIMGLESVR